MERPTISQIEASEIENICPVVQWFIDNEGGLQKRGLYQLFGRLLFLGYVPREEFRENTFCEFSPPSHWNKFGVTNRLCTSIHNKCLALKDKDGKINKVDFGGLLNKIDRNIRAYVMFLREYDKTGNQLEKFLNHLDTILRKSEFPSPNSSSGIMFMLATSRVQVEAFISASKENQTLATVFVSKTFLEVLFYILCWFHLCWYGEEFYRPPMPPE